jgi:Phage minor capsid protein 2
MPAPAKRPPSEQHDKQVEELATRYETAAQAIAAAIALAAAAGTPSALSATRTAVQTALNALLAASVAWINLHVPRIYLGGVQDAVRAIQGPSQENLRAQAEDAMRRNEHRTAMETLAEAVRDDLQGAIEGMGRDANKALGEIRRRSVQKALARGAPTATAQDFAAEVRDRGVRLRDKSGRNWHPETYARTVLRTHVASILNAGHLNKTLEMGSRYVRVFDGGPGDVDLPCKEANGQTWGVGYAASHMPEHPNCRRSFAALDPGYSGVVDREAA